MAVILDNVPLVIQSQSYSWADTQDPTGQRSESLVLPNGEPVNRDCWYSSLCMLAYYHEAGPRLGSPYLWANPTRLPILRDDMNFAPHWRDRAFTRGVQRAFASSSENGSTPQSSAWYASIGLSHGQTFYRLLKNEQLEPLRLAQPCARAMALPAFAQLIENTLSAPQAGGLHRPIMAFVQTWLPRQSRWQGHVVVIVGIGNDYIYYNDPLHQVRQQKPIDAFQQWLRPTVYALVIKSRAIYPP